MDTPWKKFEEDYQAEKIPADNKKGFRVVYRYVGPWAECRLEESVFRKTKAAIIVLYVLELLLLIISGLQQTAVNMAASVSVCTGVTLALYIYELTAILPLIRLQMRVPKRSYEELDRKLRAIPALTAAIRLLAFVFALAIRIRGGASADTPVCLSFLAEAVCSAGQYMIFRRLKFYPCV